MVKTDFCEAISQSICFCLVNQIPCWKVDVTEYSKLVSNGVFEGAFVEKLGAQMSLLTQKRQQKTKYNLLFGPPNLDWTMGTRVAVDSSSGTTREGVASYVINLP